MVPPNTFSQYAENSNNNQLLFWQIWIYFKIFWKKNSKVVFDPERLIYLDWGLQKLPLF